jgi:hypothetical protein
LSISLQLHLISPRFLGLPMSVTGKR